MLISILFFSEYILDVLRELKIDTTVKDYRLVICIPEAYVPQKIVIWSCSDTLKCSRWKKRIKKFREISNASKTWLKNHPSPTIK
jgi:hypothetical protein